MSAPDIRTSSKASACVVSRRCGSASLLLGWEGTERDGDLGSVIERDAFVADNLVGLVSFAGYKHDVSRACRYRRQPDGLAPVNNPVSSFGRVHPSTDVVHDCLRLFGARVVAGYDNMVGKRLCDRSHDAPLRGVPVASATEDAPYLLIGSSRFTDGLERSEERRVGSGDSSGWW